MLEMKLNLNKCSGAISYCALQTNQRFCPVVGAKAELVMNHAH
jgi:hypothetical protein